MASFLVKGAAALLGIVSHVGYYNRGEHHMYGIRYIQALIVACITATGVLVRLQSYSLGAAWSTVWPAVGFYLVGLYTSLLTYRAFLHPLNKFPGPFGARLSNLWFSIQVVKADAPQQLLKLHERYGQFLRIGSNDLSISHPDAVNAIYGLGSKCTKAPWYDCDQPFISLFTTRDRTMHDRRRRIWSPAFSDKALRGYETRLKPYSTLLAEQLKAFGGKAVDVSQWFNYFSYDAMGDLAFSESFGMLQKAEDHWAIKLLSDSMDPLHFHFPIWLFRVAIKIPGAMNDYWKFKTYCSKQLDKRLNKSVDTADIMSALLAPHEKTSTAPSAAERDFLQADSQTIIVAGSETTAATLTYLFYYLAKEPQHVVRLRKELGPFVDANGDFKHANVMQAEYLQGCINEAQRLHPPVPSAIQRTTPPEGIVIDGQHIPGGTNVWCPQWVIGRSETCYQDASSFIPERWSTRPSLVTNKSTFAPFGTGVYGCIGKPLALLEVRTVVARLIIDFEVDLAPGEDGSKLLNESRDHFTIGPARLNLVFKARKAMDERFG